MQLRKKILFNPICNVVTRLFIYDEIMDSDEEVLEKSISPIGPITRVRTKTMESLVSLKEKTIMGWVTLLSYE